jgi:hypothetical protein
MTKWILGVLVALAMLIGAPTASADTDALAEAPPTSTPMPALPVIESLEPVATAYWALRGVTLPPVEVFYVEKIPSDWAAAEEPGSRIWLTEAFLNQTGRGGRELQCIVWLHERGHTAGLTHESPDPVMNADLAGAPGFRVPPKCKEWARS